MRRMNKFINFNWLINWLIIEQTHPWSPLVQCLSDAWQHHSSLKFSLLLKSIASFSLFQRWVAPNTFCLSLDFASTEVQFLLNHMNATQVIGQHRELVQPSSLHHLEEYNSCYYSYHWHINKANGSFSIVLTIRFVCMQFLTKKALPEHSTVMTADGWISWLHEIKSAGLSRIISPNSTM